MSRMGTCRHPRQIQELLTMVAVPKPVCVIDGVPWWNWLFEYDWDGATYTFHICARSEQEARERLNRLPLARYVGQADGMPRSVYSPQAWWGMLQVLWRRVFRREGGAAPGKRRFP